MLFGIAPLPLRPAADQSRARALLEAGRLDVEYHESDAGHQVDRAHVLLALDWLRATLNLDQATAG